MEKAKAEVVVRMGVGHAAELYRELAKSSHGPHTRRLLRLMAEATARAGVSLASG